MGTSQRKQTDSNPIVNRSIERIKPSHGPQNTCKRNLNWEWLNIPDSYIYKSICELILAVRFEYKIG